MEPLNTLPKEKVKNDPQCLVEANTKLERSRGVACSGKLKKVRKHVRRLK